MCGPHHRIDNLTQKAIIKVEMLLFHPICLFTIDFFFIDDEAPIHECILALYYENGRSVIVVILTHIITYADYSQAKCEIKLKMIHHEMSRIY